MKKTDSRILLALLLVLLALNAGAQTTDTDFYPPEQYVSGTLPVLYITTEDSVPITSKTEYVRAAWRLDAMGVEGVDDIGTVDEQYGMWIRGRGNTSWARAKKPYRIKLDDEVPLLGMKPNRHFVLLTEWRDGWGRIAWEMGFTVNRLMGMPWTPDHQPVELVLNGSYMGLYFLAEKIRVDKDRINITDQKGKLYDPALVTGGWLCEIDNYVSSPRVLLTDRTTHVPLRTTIHSPEEVSSVQYNYISQLVDAVDKAIYCPDKTSTDWERYIDLDRIARYYVACEIIYQIECFSGSCFWSKERGDSTKIMFGPMWDFDTSNLRWTVQKFCYEQQENDEVMNRNHWIAEIAKYPRFQQRVRELWAEWNQSGAPQQLRPHAAEWLQRIEAAHYKDVDRWYEYMKNYVNVHERFESYFRHFDKHQAWLAEQWAKPVEVIGDLDSNWVVDDRDVALMTRHLLAQEFDALPATANTYDDEVIDLSDLVGVVRQVYRREHSGVALHSPITLPYGQSDKDVDPNVGLALCFPDGADTLRLVGGDQRVVPIAIAGAPSTSSAFQFDLSTTGLHVADISLAEPLADTHRLHIVNLADTALRVVVLSDSLAHFDASGRVPALVLTLSYDNKTGGSYSQAALRFSGVRVVESDMFPHYAADCDLPFTWRRVNLAGDIDANGVIDIDDLNAALNVMLHKAKVDDFPYADTNRSGQVDIDDVNVVINGILRKTSIVDYAVGDVHFKMVRMKGGTFTMGATPEQEEYATDNEQPPHRVTVSDFAIGQTEVTQALWLAVMGSNPSQFTDDLLRPVDNVSWNDCQEFIARLNELTGRRFRLPTEAEWEFAARGGNSSQGFRYAGSNTPSEVAWYNTNSPRPVAQKKPNELGLYDMSGNVSEWCQDRYAHYSGPEEQVDPTGPDTGDRRVFRGGCWFNLKNVCRVSYRGKLEPNTRSKYYGLRLAM